MKRNKKNTKTEPKKKPKNVDEALEEVEEEYKTNLIYNFFNFFIGGDNSADIKNKQEGKPPTYWHDTRLAYILIFGFWCSVQALEL